MRIAGAANEGVMPEGCGRVQPETRARWLKLKPSWRHSIGGDGWEFGHASAPNFERLHVAVRGLMASYGMWGRRTRADRRGDCEMSHG